MSVVNRITMIPFPEADSAMEFYSDSNSWFDVVSPPGHGWHLENAFLGNNVVYFIWKKGSIRFDGGLVHYWTGYGDDVANDTYGNGTRLYLNNTVDTATMSVDVDFIHTDTYLYGGTIVSDLTVLGNEVTIEYLSKPTTLTVDTEGDVIVDNGIVRPDSNGTHTIDDYALIPFSGGDWDFDDATQTLIPNLGSGNYILKTTEMLLSRPVNRILISGINGTEQTVIGGNGIQLYKGGFFRITTHNLTNTDWKAYLYFHLCRNRTIDL